MFQTTSRKDPNILWNALEKRYAELTRAQVTQIKHQIFRTHRSDFTKLNNHLLAMQKHHTKLIQGGVKWTEETQIDDIINFLGTNYNHWINSLTNEQLKKKEDFLAALSQHDNHEEVIKQKQSDNQTYETERSNMATGYRAQGKKPFRDNSKKGGC
jgi:hypothetical protein